jgi:hypothetical protein
MERATDAARRRGQGSSPNSSYARPQPTTSPPGGESNPRIASDLGVSELTVKRHVSNILTKLDLPGRAAAAAYAVRHHLA